MAFRHGKSTKILFGRYDLSPYLNESTVSETVDTAETTAYGKAAKTYIAGQADGTISLSGMFDGDQNATDETFSTALGDDTGIVVTVAPEGLAAGRRLQVSKVKQTSYESSAPVADVVAVSVEVQADGGVDRGISLTPLDAKSANGTGDAQDNAASSANGGVGVLHVTANTRNGNSTIKVQHSADNAVWADLITFTAVGSSTTTSERIEVSGTVNRYLRMSHTLAGSTGEITYHASFSRK